MKNLTGFNIVKCDELQKEVHDKLFEKYYDRIYELENYECEFTVQFVDDFHKKHYDKDVFLGKLKDISDVLDLQDYKNGVDILIDGRKNLVFMVYGQGYEYNGKYSLVTTKIRIRAKDAENRKIDFDVALNGNEKEKEKAKEAER